MWPVAALALAIGGIAALGGFADAPVQSLPRIALGEVYEGGEVITSVESATLADEVDGFGPAAEGETFVVVEAIVTNTADEAAGTQIDTVRVRLGDEIDPDAPADVTVDTGTGELPGFLQPGLPTRLAYVWRIDSDAARTGDEIVVGVFENERVENDPLWGDTAYGGPVPKRRIITELGARA